MSQNIFNLALDFFRSPGAHEELINPGSPLPPDVSALLDVIAGEKDPTLESSIVVSEELRAAISFLIERSFFVPGADFYRVLGLNRDAGPDKIRRHYNQLMNIFLLDRGDKAANWNTSHAMLINRAYSVLRDPEQRRSYDQSLQPTALSGRGKITGNPANPIDKISYFPGLGDVPSEVERDAAGLTAAVAKKAAPVSYIAHSIDRASSVSTEAPKPADAEWSRAADFAADELLPGHPAVQTAGLSGDLIETDPFPKAIPMPEQVRHHHSPFKSFFKGSIAIGLLAAAMIAVAIYILGMPTVLEAPSETVSAVDSVVSKTGSVERDDVTSPQPEESPLMSDAAGSTGPLLDDSGQDESKTDVLAQSAIGSEPIADFGTVKTQSNGRQDVTALAPDSGKTSAAVVQSAGSGAPVSTLNQPEVAAARNKTAPKAKTRKSASEEVSPAKKLEAMRPPQPIEKIDPPVSSADTNIAAVPSSVGSELSALSQLPLVSPDASPAITSVLPAREPTVETVPLEELENLTTTFSQAYEKGNLPLLLSLFADDASTNDQDNKEGIRKDYLELFNLTERRAFVIEGVQWKGDKGGGFMGEGAFHVYVKLKNNPVSNTLDGRVTFHVQKSPQGLLINRMLHAYD